MVSTPLCPEGCFQQMAEDHNSQCVPLPTYSARGPVLRPITPPYCPFQGAGLEQNTGR